MSTPTATGRCVCGAVRYELRGDLRGILVCHCVECRRYHGTSGAYTAVAREGLTLRDDEGLLRWFPGPQSETGGERGFCSRCGSSLLWREPDSATYSVAAGTLEGATGLRIDAAHLVRAASRLGARRPPAARAARQLAARPVPARGGRLHERSEERCAGESRRFLGMPQHGHAEGAAGSSIASMLPSSARPETIEPLTQLRDALMVVGVDGVDGLAEDVRRGRTRPPSSHGGGRTCRVADGAAPGRARRERGPGRAFRRAAR